MKINKELKVALVTDWMVAPGGADRLLVSIAKLFNKPDIFTALYFSEKYDSSFGFEEMNIYDSFLHRIPFIEKLHRHVNVLSPLAFESFDLANYDLLISLSAGAAKGIIPKPDQKHLSIILTPPRSLWDKESNVRASKLRFLYRLLSPFFASYMRLWDQTAILRADELVSISEFIQKKVQKVYRKESEVIYPGLPDYWYLQLESEYKPSFIDRLPESYFLVVSRLYDYKRVDVAIKAAIQSHSKLVVVGVGPDRSYLEQISNSDIIFLDYVVDDDLKYLYANASALLFCGIEDYGYVPVEAMASGCPVYAYDEGGLLETVEDGYSGEFFHTIDELAVLLENHSDYAWNEDEIVDRAYLFDEQKFHKRLTEFIDLEL